MWGKRKNRMNLKVCKDGRIWGQTNKEARTHLGILINKRRTKKGYSCLIIKELELKNIKKLTKRIINFKGGVCRES